MNFSCHNSVWSIQELKRVLFDNIILTSVSVFFGSADKSNERKKNGCVSLREYMLYKSSCWLRKTIKKLNFQYIAKKIDDIIYCIFPF